MNLELDHFFIIVEPGARVAERLISLGLTEGSPNTHQGQGTTSRRFYFSNSMLELLWVHDAAEAAGGPVQELFFPERAADPTASPFGVILHRTDNSSLEMPFPGWEYQPEYFDPPWAFHVGANSSNLLEPLCIYVPFVEPRKRTLESGKFRAISEVLITTPSKPLSDVLGIAGAAAGLTIEHGTEHLMEISFDGRREGRSSDLRPDLPIIVHW